MASASEPGVQRPKTFGAGLGGVKPSAGAWGRRESPKAKKAAEPFPVQPGRCFWGRSIVVGHGDRDGGSWIIEVECATSGDQLYEPGAAIVVAHVKRKRQAGSAGL